MIKRDGHIHTPFCPHGSKDAMEEYVERLIALGYTHITFTEHAPLPRDFIDPVPEKDSAIQFGQMDDYLKEIDRLKRKYDGRIVILAGLEVDYIEGYEEGTKELLTKYGPFLDDSILSVHFLKKDGAWYCLDYSDETFGKMTEAYGGVDAVHEDYYRAVLSSIRSDLGPYKPKRIGHMTLANKFQKLYPTTRSFSRDISTILEAILANGLEVDYNGAGVIKPHCGESYPPEPVIRKAYGMGIPVVYGSDAHTVRGLDQGRTRMTFL